MIKKKEESMQDVFKGAKNLGFGLMRLPLLDGNDDSKIDIETLKTMVDMFIERGFTYFDTAWMYCGFASESAIKEALVKRYPRDKFTLATKLHSGFINVQEDMDKVFDAQREKTGVEFFDYYLIHDVNAHSIETYDRLDAWSWLINKKKEGLVKNIGFSFHDSPELLEKVLKEHPQMEFVQLQINYLDYDSPAIKSRENYMLAEKYDKPVIVMEPIKGGTLINVSDQVKKLFEEANPDASIASWAVRFAASHKNVKMVLSGMNKIEDMDNNTAYMKNFSPLTEKEKELVFKAADIMNKEIAIPCTGCSYCTEGCPKKIAIPKYFALYNAEMKQNPDGKLGWTPQMGYYANISKDFGKAGDCIKCRKCEKICPQHLEITEFLKTVADRFE